MAFYGAVAGCTLEKKYDHENTGTMNLIRNFLPFLLFVHSENPSRFELGEKFIFYKNGYSDVGDGCWRQIC